MDLDAIVTCLAHHRQRATYGAVASLVSVIPLVVMKGRPRNHLNSWVVAQEDHEPTDYTIAEKDPDLRLSPFVIEDQTVVQRWLSSRL